MLINGNSIHIPLQDKSVHCVITSPPYYGLRNYKTQEQIWGGDPHCSHEWGMHTIGRVTGGADRPPDNKWKNVAPDGNYDSQTVRSTCLRCGAWRGSLGLEQSPDEYVAHLVAVFREVWRVLRDDGTLWLNLGDSYAGQGGTQSAPGINAQVDATLSGEQTRSASGNGKSRNAPIGLKPKDLIGIPWRVAFALQADGWYLRRDIIWHKENCMPESVTDRPTTAHEYVFLLSKSQHYFYDADAIAEPAHAKGRAPGGNHKVDASRNDAKRDMTIPTASTRNRRSVWTVNTQPYNGAHFATFPTALVLPMVLAGTSEYGVCSVCGAPWKRSVDRENRYEKRENTHTPNGAPTKVDSTGWQSPIITDSGFIPTCKCNAEITQPIVLDPFCGSGTVGEVCRNTGRKFVGIDLSSTYLHELAAQRAEGKIFIKQEINGELKTLVTEQRRLF